MERKTYSFEEAYEESLKYFGGDQLAARVWVNKYAMKDSFGHIFEKSPVDMHWRIANEIARIEQKYPNPMSARQVFDLLDHFRYLVPGGSPMAGIGNKHQVSSLSNCFVIGLEGDADSYGAIMKIDEEQVQLMKRRGGVGHDLSQIRPKGSPVNNSALTSTGLVPFMERYSNSTREVAQDGRRGALMLSVSIKHPDSEDFINAKLEEGKVTGANISVKIDDEFMKDAIADEPYVQQFPIDAKDPKMTKTISARKLWCKIVHNAWKSAEPGVLFWDTILRESVPDCYADLGFRTVSTNPCGEIPLCPYDSCRLLAINLYSYVENPFTKDAYFNFDKFKQHVQYGQRLMDDIVDLEMEKIDGILD
jgi:ribonucleoside-diphosphate reductase alpha chain